MFTKFCYIGKMPIVAHKPVNDQLQMNVCMSDSLSIRNVYQFCVYDLDPLSSPEKSTIITSFCSLFLLHANCNLEWFSWRISFWPRFN